MTDGQRQKVGNLTINSQTFLMISLQGAACPIALSMNLLEPWNVQSLKRIDG